MTGSGRKLTRAERATILRMVMQRDADGKWLLSYQEIADRLRLDRKTVAETVRWAAGQFQRLDGLP